MSDVIKHLDLSSADGAQLNMDALYQIAPSAFTEVRDDKTGEISRKVNFEVLRQLLGDHATDGEGEMYQFTWVGKNAARAEAAAPTTKTLRPVVEDSVDWDTTKNIYIEGDNLEVLKLLQRSYMGKVKMIYIDPPYNTGNDFVYHDDFARTAAEEDLEAGNVDELGNRFRKNTDTNGKFHSDWCSMIYPRLMVARSLLTEDGVIFISIDENEVENLRKICDEVMGASNFGGEIIWKNSSKNDQAYISIQHEYILCYVKNKAVNLGDWVEYKEGIDEIFKAFDGFKKQYGNDWDAIHRAALEWYKQFPESNPIYGSKHYSWMDEKGVYFPDNISGPNFGQYRYDVVHPITGKYVKEPASGWRYPQKTMEERIKQGLVHFGKDETTVPNNKTYLANTVTQSLTSIKYKDGRVASKYLTTLMGANVFNNPKDTSILEVLMKAIGIADNDIVLDFFSGSASTGEAVFDIASKDIANARFILVQIAENLDTALEKAVGGAKTILKNAIDLCEDLGKPHTIPELAKERIRRAGKKIKEELEAKIKESEKKGPSLFDNEEESSQTQSSSIDTGFRVYRLDESNYENVSLSPKEYKQDQLDLFANNIKADRTDLDLLYGAMLAWGVQLDLPLQTEEVDGCTVYTVNEGDLVACFAEGITDKVVATMAEKSPLRILFRDACFKEDAQKINIYEQFKQALDWADDEAFKNIRVI